VSVRRRGRSLDKNQKRAVRLFLECLSKAGRIGKAHALRDLIYPTRDLQEARSITIGSDESIPTGAVAEAVGYQSEAAFQRAFKSHMGVTPAQWRKTQESPDQDIFARLAASGDAQPATMAEADTIDETRPAKSGSVS
jgi:Bacterial regulatory helix-turn-helix proteins, AraC family